ncbi:isocitrate lyase/PEP mutase family protein [Nakamurella endophytica]|uniref:Carboxyvinyl-carboxyphosphonate phosphorylmutase n=1 Tax=Nakamurella endophytica TaxID=1748367 RepID=A0A917T4B3_9ACTN|nr:isocitrate lyase/phosphoenolpyruvate mutase family protein [Nakamurella endophytica]GGM08700.1 carboxyvinyl-carboxyphosphonate phosphorylmutase [Nakamurella endophytica]
MTARDLAGEASALRALHEPGRPLVLPNVWDAASARAVHNAGFPVVATSSAAVAGSLGFVDDDIAPAAEMLAAAARIAAAVDVPVTVDAEAGWGLEPVELVAALIDAGAVGCNLEDTDHRGSGLTDPPVQADYLAGVRDAAEAAGVPLVVNARIDVFERAADGADGEELFAEAVDRARTYLSAGADCVYPISLHDPSAAARFCAAVGGAAVNLLGSWTPAAGRITVADAAAAGAARVSFGPDLWRATLRHLDVLLRL